ncbi:uncharacterized protein BJX67DRAFT_20555 [Aspergillus lucknowensis]|uniref:Uncharacterized protein n=1 Tax=Aspergillus lucknowensis TaxID=176173 RepID=A0ABR4M886_9EURO
MVENELENERYWYDLLFPTADHAERVGRPFLACVGSTPSVSPTFCRGLLIRTIAGKSSSFFSNRGCYYLILSNSESTPCFVAASESAIMNNDIVEKFGPGMSFYRSQITPSSKKTKPEEALLNGPM